MEWKELIDGEKRKKYFINLEMFLAMEYRSKKIYPKEEDIYTAFDLCPFKNVKVVILGQDPYHNPGQANGLAFSVKDGVKIPPSLRNIFKEMGSDLKIETPLTGNLIPWAKQGVLLLNTILTVEENQPLAHANKGWEKFTDKVLQELNKDNSPKVFVLWGKNAYKKELFITNEKHLVIKSSHPSPLSARHSFFGSKVFTKINKFLLQNNLDQIDFRI
jgi:uracil-DNA glycosylase